MGAGEEEPDGFGVRGARPPAAAPLPVVVTTASDRATAARVLRTIRMFDSS
jgi:hypothetical protein